MKILVYGAGVLGSLYAARLQNGGHTVDILARGQRLADLRQYGIVLEDDQTGNQTTTRVGVIEQIGPQDAYDLVLVIVRKNQLTSVLPPLAANQHTPNVLFMVNNAAGPQEIMQALGPSRVLLGFPGAGGARCGHVVRYVSVSGRIQPTTIGELNGTITPRLQTIARALQQAGCPVAFSLNIDAWLKTHVAIVSPIANALYAVGGDNYRLARTRDGVVLMVRAVREGYAVLRALHIPIMPRQLNVIEWMPEPLLVAILQRSLPSRRAELALARHANAARDEMKQLADEFRALIRQTSVPTPAINQLYTYLDPAAPLLAEGSQKMPLYWRSVWAALGVVLFGLMIAGVILRPFRPAHIAPRLPPELIT